jgi:hypothetical protein
VLINRRLTNIKKASLNHFEVCITGTSTSKKNTIQR